ncbi:polyprenyl synthetase family protein [Dactylosporangium sp. CA-092794]|uniref:polyprenyl synthetase family protein n=1 Tax=Dactylosporangium sp. CA-092794 TaxID=3239929 RepID=UPI003D9441A5
MTTMLESLHRSRDAITPAMRAALDRLDASTRKQAAYHLGWIDVDGRPTASHGKAVRPALALLSAQAAGGPEEIGLPGAVAVELVHNFSLLHDDYMDRDLERRHRRTVWAVWGPSSAILTGDALLALAQEVLLDSGLPTAAPAALRLARATRELIRGQVQDLAFEQRDRVTLPECVDMAGGKTGALMSASAAIGAVLAGAPEATVDGLATFGAQLGLAFQLVDDVLGIWGDPAVTGKPVHSDLRAHKKSLPVTYALEQGADIDPGDDEESVRRAAEAVEAAGGRDWALAEAERRLALGEAALGRLDLPGRVRDELFALGRFMIDREV